MRLSTWALLLAAFILTAVPVRAADLAKIERKIAKEPAYKEKPQYVLLVFGAEAKFRVWLVRDGKVLYVDRNGNGDLTEVGKRLPIKGVSVRVGEFKDGATSYYLDVAWYKRPNVNGLCWTIDVTGKYQYRAGRDAQGHLQGAVRPQDAPIIHVDGPLGLELCSFCGDNTTELVRNKTVGGFGGGFGASIGTTGLGKGSFAYVVPATNDKMKLLAEVEFSLPDAAEKPKPVSVSMTRDDGGCCSFSGGLQVPEKATKAKITLSAPDWKGDKLPAVTREIPVVEAKPRQ